MKLEGHTECYSCAMFSQGVSDELSEWADHIVPLYDCFLNKRYQIHRAAGPVSLHEMRTCGAQGHVFLALESSGCSPLKVFSGNKKKSP